MWQDKKFIIIASLLVLLVAAVGTIGGILLVRQGNAEQNREMMADNSHKVTIVLPNNNNLGTTTPQEALNNYLDKLVTDGKITQKQADDFKAWLKNMPEMSGIFSDANQPGSGILDRMRNMMGGFGFKFGQ